MAGKWVEQVGSTHRLNEVPLGQQVAGLGLEPRCADTVSSSWRAGNTPESRGRCGVRMLASAGLPCDHTSCHRRDGTFPAEPGWSLSQAASISEKAALWEESGQWYREVAIQG